eukprot:12538-Prymnesium_polylepis.1
MRAQARMRAQAWMRARVSCACARARALPARHAPLLPAVARVFSCAPSPYSLTPSHAAALQFSAPSGEWPPVGWKETERPMNGSSA